MTNTAPTRKFWTTLALFNIATVVYPIFGFITSNGDSEQFFAALILITVFFLLWLVDTIAITLAYALCD